jgi:hypothetical protein
MTMHAALALALLLGADKAPAAPKADVFSHGVHIVAPAGWARSNDGDTAVFDAPEKMASVRIDTFQKPKETDAQDCLDELVKKLSNGDKKVAETYSQSVLDGQPSATQTTFTDDRKHRQKRVVGCNGKSYFLIDWVELTHAGPKYEKGFTKLLTGIKYEPTGDAKPSK